MNQVSHEKPQNVGETCHLDAAKHLNLKHCQITITTENLKKYSVANKLTNIYQNARESAKNSPQPTSWHRVKKQRLHNKPASVFQSGTLSHIDLGCCLESFFGKAVIFRVLATLGTLTNFRVSFQ